MAGIPNQSNINKTIKAQIGDINKVIECVVKASTSRTAILASNSLKDIKQYQMVINTIMGTDGIVTSISNTVQNLQKTASIKVPSLRSLRIAVRRVFKFMDYLSSYELDPKKLEKIKEKLAPVITVCNNLNDIFKTIAKIDTPKLFTTKFLMIKISLWRITKLSGFLALLNLMVPVMAASKVSLMMLNTITTSLSKVFADIASIKITLMTFVKLFLIPVVLRGLMNIVRTVSIVARYIRRQGGLKDALVLSVVFNMLESVFASIKAIKVGIFMRIKLNMICRVLLILNRVVRMIARIRIRPKALLNMIILKMLFFQLGMVLLAAILVTPIAILSIPAMGILLLVLWVFARVIRFLVRILVRLASTQVIKGVAALLLICTFLTLLAMMFLVLSMVAKPIVKATGWLIGLVLTIVLVAVTIGVLGALIGAIGSYLSIAILGLVVMLVIIGIMLLMALMLRLLQMLNLDAEAIAEKVAIVIGTCKTIITEIFRPDEENDEGSERGFIGTLISFIGNGITMVAQAIMAVAYLALMVFAVLSILLIAMMLQWIQDLKLDETRIYANVEMVIKTTQMINKILFGGDPESDKASNKSWITSIIEYFGTGLVMIAQAIMAVAFLAVAVVSVLLVLIIASLLRGLQEIELDSNAINKNVYIVISTAQSVVDMVLGGADKNTASSSKSWIVSVIEKFAKGYVAIVQAIMAIAFLALSVVSILLVMFIAGELRLLQTINLDAGKISEKVKTVINSAKLVADCIMSGEDQNSKESSKSWIVSVIEKFANGYLSIVKAIMAIAFLALAVVSILLVNFIAMELAILQNIALNPGKIDAKVKTVISSAKLVADCIMGAEDQNSKASDKNWIVAVVEQFATGYISIVKAIMAIAFLALAVVTILLVLFLAGQLALLQNIALKPDKINTNIGIVINSAKGVGNALFYGEAANNKESDKNWIVSVIEGFAGTYISIIQAIMAIAFLAISIVAILLVQILAGQLALLQEIPLAPDKIAENITTVINSAKLVGDMLFYGDPAENTESDKNWIVSVIEGFASSFISIVQAIMAISFLAMSIVAILLIQILAGQLALLQEIPLDPNKIAQNVTTVITTCQLVIDSIVLQQDKPDQASKKSWIRKLLEFVGADGLLKIVDCIMALAWLGFAVAIINLVGILAIQLATISKIKIGKNIKEKTNQIVDTANTVISCVTNRKDPISGNSDSKKMKLLKWLFPRIAEAAEMMSKMKWVSSVVSTVGVVHQVAEALTTLNKLPDLSNAKSKAQQVCNTADDIAKMIIARTGADVEDGYSRLKFLERLNRIVRAISSIRPAEIKKSRDAIAAHINLIEKIDKMDVKKLETSTQMFGHMAAFSRSIRGDFAQLANTLNEDLLPTIKELKELLSETKLTLEETTNKLEQMRELQQKQDSREDSTKTLEDFKEEVRNSNPELDESKVDAKAREKKSKYDKSHKESVKSIVKDIFDLMDNKQLTVKTTNG